MTKKKKTEREANQYDKIIKENLAAVTPRLIREVLHIEAVEMLHVPLKLQRTKEREPDFLKIIIDKNGRKFILHIEFQLVDDNGMIFRNMEYYAMTGRIYPDLEIEQYVIFIGNKAPSMTTLLQRKNIVFQYNLISLLNIDYKIFLNGKPEEAIFGILANFGNENPEIIVSNIIQQIRTDSTSELERLKCYEQLRTLANLRNLQPLIEQLMQSISQFLNKEIDPWYKEGVEKGLERGLERGLEKGKFEFVFNLIANTDFDDAKIAFLVQTTIEFVKEIRLDYINKQSVIN